MTHHIVTWCDELANNRNVEFYVFETESFPLHRIAQGYEDWQKTRPYCINVNESVPNKRFAELLSVNADIAIFAGGSYYYQDLRSRFPLKISFKLKERLYKYGLDQKYDQRVCEELYQKHGRFLTTNLYYLCVGSYTAYDVNYQGFETSRLIQWGYFPPFIKHDIEKFSTLSYPISILWIGNMEMAKQPIMALEAIEILVKSGYEVNLKYIGDGELRAKLESLIIEKGLNKQVQILPYMSWRKVREELINNGMCIITSNYAEGWGAVISEAMNDGNIVLSSTASGATGVLIKHKYNGLWFDHTSPEQLAESIKWVYDNPNVHKEIRRNAYHTISSKWNGRIAAERLYHVICSVLNDRRVDYFQDNGICSQPQLIETIHDLWKLV